MISNEAIVTYSKEVSVVYCGITNGRPAETLRQHFR
jgi:hypothetical protein